MTLRARFRALADGVQDLATRHQRLVNWLSTAWLMLVGFAYAGFVPLPEIAFLHSRAAMFAGTAWNALWWAVLRPMLKRRALARAQEPAAAA